MPAWRYAPQFAVLFFFILSRIGIHALGIAPDPTIVVTHWQHADLNLLASDPFGTLWNLHTQPPLWNGILAVAASLVGPEGDAVTLAIHGFNIALSAGVGLMVLSMLRTLRFPPIVSVVLAVVAICSPNVVYFEQLAFYPHFTFFLVTLLVWLLLGMRREGPLWRVAVAFGVLAALSWTWAIFHPAFAGLFAAGLALWWGGWKSSARPVYALAALAFCVACLPTIKNFMTYGVPSASTWIGLNLAQTVPGGQTGELVRCDFTTANRAAIAAPLPPRAVHPVLTVASKGPDAPNMNHAGMIETSRQCLNLTKDVVLRDPIGWAGGRLSALAGSHQLPPSNYDRDPVGWERSMGRCRKRLGADRRGGACSDDRLVCRAVLGRVQKHQDQPALLSEPAAVHRLLHAGVSFPQWRGAGADALHDRADLSFPGHDNAGGHRAVCRIAPEEQARRAFASGRVTLRRPAREMPPKAATHLAPRGSPEGR